MAVITFNLSNPIQSMKAFYQHVQYTDIILSIYYITHHFKVNKSAHFLLGADLTLVIACVIGGDPSGNNNSILYNI